MNREQILVEYEIVIRLLVFVLVFGLIALWEWKAPARHLTLPKASRWLNNLVLVLLNSVLVRLLFPLAAVGMTLFVEQAGLGLFNVTSLSGLPWSVQVMATVVLMDFCIWLQHLLFHRVPLLWRLHRVHHADRDFDVTTGLRFHPLEVLLSMLIKFAVIALLGPPVAGVILFELLLNASAMFNHANVHLPTGLERVLRQIVVTPDMHRVHHSVEDDEANSNFGFCLSWWDRLFGSWREQPRAGHEAMQIGIKACRDPRQVVRLGGMLRLPFTAKIDARNPIFRQ